MVPFQLKELLIVSGSHSSERDQEIMRKGVAFFANNFQSSKTTHPARNLLSSKATNLQMIKTNPSRSQSKGVTPFEQPKKEENSSKVQMQTMETLEGCETPDELPRKPSLKQGTSNIRMSFDKEIFKQKRLNIGRRGIEQKTETHGAIPTIPNPRTHLAKNKGTRISLTKLKNNSTLKEEEGETSRRTGVSIEHSLENKTTHPSQMSLWNFGNNCKDSQVCLGNSDTDRSSNEIPLINHEDFSAFQSYRPHQGYHHHRVTSMPLNNFWPRQHQTDDFRKHDQVFTERLDYSTIQREPGNQAAIKREKENQDHSQLFPENNEALSRYYFSERSCESEVGNFQVNGEGPLKKEELQGVLKEVNKQKNMERKVRKYHRAQSSQINLEEVSRLLNSLEGPLLKGEEERKNGVKINRSNSSFLFDGSSVLNENQESIWGFEEVMGRLKQEKLV